MAHELDTTTGRSAIAFIGETPWHNLGQRLQPGADLLTWQQEAGLDWTAERSAVQYERRIVDHDGSLTPITAKTDRHFVLYRSDTGGVLSVVSDRYKPVQPKEIIEFYRDLVEKHGFELEVAGALKDGRKVWALANTHNVCKLRGGDEIRGYLLLATSYDGSMATQARFTSVRVVCNNTLTVAVEGKPEVSVPHSTSFDANQVKITLKVGDAWEAFTRNAEAMTNRLITRDETVRFLLDAYHGLVNDEQVREFNEANPKAGEKTMTRLTKALFESPGAHMASARGTLWGVLNAVTNDVDFNAPARTQDNRLNAAWFGRGEQIKQRAWALATKLVA